MAARLVVSARKTPTIFDEGYNPSFEIDETPCCLSWTTDDVADWVEYLGFKQYRNCFTENLINGRKLIQVNASTLPRMGITDFEHIKALSKHIQEALGIEEPKWNRSISLLHRELMGLFLERKSKTGEEADALTFENFCNQMEKQERDRMRIPKKKKIKKQ